MQQSLDCYKIFMGWYTWCEVKDMDDKYKIALCQMMVTPDKEQNIHKMEQFVGEAAESGARIVCLPEIWNSPYDVNLFGDYAEPDDGPSVRAMSELARKSGIYLVGGSIPEKELVSEKNLSNDKALFYDKGLSNEKDLSNEKENGKPCMYNTSFVFDPEGKVIAKHRKVHLFDVDIKNGIRFKESDFFTAGSSITLFDTDFGRIGLAICFDVRFPEMFREMAKEGAHLIFLPASFNMTTGPAHWDLLIRSRALDNQIYMAACASARNPSASYTSWGHSCVATPWGEYCAAADANESIVYATVDKGYMQKVRKEIPIGN